MPREYERKRPFKYREYHHVSLEKFNELEQSGKLEWSITLESGRYATPRTLFERNRDTTLLFLVTPDVVPRIRDLSKGPVVSFYFFPPPMEEIIRRMKARRDTEDEIAKRVVDSRSSSWISPLKDSSIQWVPIITEDRSVEQTIQMIRDHLGI